MEPVISLPTDFAAIAELPPRGAAPLLRSPGAGGPAPPTAVPFELLLGLLTEPLPGGEAWPVGGKKLPLPRLDAAAESAAPPATGFGVSAWPQLAGARAADSPAAWPASARGLSPLPKAEAPSAAARLAPWLAAVPTAAAPASAGTEQLVGFEPAAPNAFVPAGAETLFADTATPPLADALPPAGPELEGLEALIANGARARAQLASAPAADARAGASAAAPPIATNVPAAVLDAYAASVRERPPSQPGAVRRLDELGALPPPAAAADAPAGVASDWLPAAHTHAHAAGGTTATAAAPPPAVPHAPVDARLPDWHEAFAQRVQWVVDTDAGEARIKLNPPELGAVDVKISLVDDKTHVHLTAATAAARDELAQALPRLRELFTVSGLELGSASVHDGRGGDHAGGGAHARHGDGVRDAAPAPLVGLLDEPSPGPRGLARGRIDVFA